MALEPEGEVVDQDANEHILEGIDNPAIIDEPVENTGVEPLDKTVENIGVEPVERNGVDSNDTEEISSNERRYTIHKNQ